MNDHDRNHHTRAPVVEPVHQASGSDLRDDVFQAVIGVTRCRGIVKGQQNSGEGLHQKKKKGDAAEHLVPSARAWNFLVEKVSDRGFQAGAVIEPIENCPPRFSHDSVSSDFWTGPSQSRLLSSFTS